MDMHVVIATHRRRELLQRTLQSLAEADRPAALAAVHVLENGSDDGTADVCRDLADRLPIEYRHYAQPGKSGAYNDALRRIGTGLVLFLDDDVRVAGELLTAYAVAAAEHGADAVYGGPIESEFVQRPADWLWDELPRSAVGWEPADPDHFDEWFLGPNYGAFAERIITVGGFDEAIGPGTGSHLGDEMDLQHRLFESGCAKLYVPAARVWHHVPPERCSPAFALKRRYLESLANTLNDRDDESKQMCGAPRWLWRKLITSGVTAGLAAVVPSARRRYAMRKPYYRWRGVLAGVRAKARTGGA